ncbi:MAG: GNAT family N-acetyltransferase [Syntrophomonadaceae bacterium]
MPEVVVNSPAAQDFDGVYALLQQLWPGKEMDRDRINRVYNLTLETGHYHYRVARQGKDIVGFISWGIKNNLWAQGWLLHIDDLIVAEPWRGRRIGAMLMDHARQFALDHSCRYLELDSGLHRVDAHRFYERYGYCKRAYNFILEI